LAVNTLLDGASVQRVMIAGVVVRFPELFDCIVKVGSTNDCFYEDDVFPENKYICFLILMSVCSLAAV